MSVECPRCGYERRPEDAAPPGECPRCGIVYSRWKERPRPAQTEPRDVYEPPPVAYEDDEEESESIPRRIVGAIFNVKPRVDRWTFYGHAAVLVFFVVWGIAILRWDMSGDELGASFMHRINLVFHEAGHIIFMPFGRFMNILGGSLMQLLVPFVVIVAFLYTNRDPFGASIGLWWLGESFRDLAPYIADARAQQLMLLGGVTGADAPGYHDWTNLLNAMEIIKYDVQIGRGSDRLGMLLMVLAMAWGAYVVYREYRNVDYDYIDLGEG